MYIVTNAGATIALSFHVLSTNSGGVIVSSVIGAIVGWWTGGQDSTNIAEDARNDVGRPNHVFASHHHVVGVADSTTCLTFRWVVVRHTDGRQFSC
jgi:hypothetical protein